MRDEQQIFDDLAKLCASPGFAHAIAYLCFRDNFVGFGDTLKPEDMLPMFSMDRLIRTEVSTLIGLLVKNEIDYTLPPPNVMQEYVDTTMALLEEMHESLSSAIFADIAKPTDMERALTTGLALREPIFYGGESAYIFQYRDLAAAKYLKDDAWLKVNKGFGINEARDVVHAVGRLQPQKLNAAVQEFRLAHPSQWTFLPAFTFTTSEIAEMASIERATVESVLTAFALPTEERNSVFYSLHDFNVTNALPILRIDDATFVLFQEYSLVQALYETPFYWMCADKSYASTSLVHRGQFTEEFSRSRLVRVFGAENVYANIDIFKAKNEKFGEIDILVIFGDRAIILQAKSKRLTIEARKGNDGQIRDDFKKSIQDSYGQGYECATALVEGNCTLRDAQSRPVPLPASLKQVYVLCVISDHYPALSFQAAQFLKFETSEKIPPPFVMDVFTLDAMTEMLESPLQLLSYVDRRTKYSNKILAAHELTCLSFHLKRNLWLSEDLDGLFLSDDISADLDVAMAVRRDHVPGERTPDGILTRSRGTTIGRIVKQIEARPEPGIVDLGFLLLTLSENAVADISKKIDEIRRRALSDNKGHDLSVSFKAPSTGLTVHCNGDPIYKAGPILERHCERRKYMEQADSWFGLCMLPQDGSLRFGLHLNFKWERNARMDAHIQDFQKSSKFDDHSRPRKIGRNDPCPCASGKKYKKCCGK